MILEKKPVTMAEAKEIISKLKESQPLKDYMKKFTKLDRKKADALMTELTALNNLKLKEENLIKIIDFIPKDAEELNKILIETSLSEEESNAILEIVKKY